MFNFGSLGAGFGRMGAAARAPAGLLAFAYEAEAAALAAAFSTPPTDARQRTINRAILRLKAGGVWAKATALYLVGANENASFQNWKTPGTYTLVKTGSPTFVADHSWLATGASQYLSTQLNANVLSQNDVGAYVWARNGAASGNSDFGAIQTGVGLSLAVRNSGAPIDAYTARVCGAASTAGLDTLHSDGVGLSGFSRNNSANWTASRNGVTKNTVSDASQALPALPIFLLTVNNGGSPSASFSPRTQSAWYFGQALTNAEERCLLGVVGEYLDTIQYGEPIVEEVGVGTENIAADCIAYGLTGQSIMFALQAARAGATVAICGGWRDRHQFGGMSAGGLGFTDFDNHASLGGLPRYVITRMNALAGVADTQFYFEPRTFHKVMRELLNPALNGGYEIPIYLSGGVTSVQKTGTVVTSWRTADGRTFYPRQWCDGSYEMDLGRLAGCSYILGREAAGSSTEANGGVKLSSTDLLFDPWNTPDTPASGLIPNVQGVRSTFSPELDTVGADGSADDKTQAYNFRLTLTTNVLRRVPFPATPPPGYDVADYEFLLRFLAANAAVDTFAELFKVDAINAGTIKNDVNNFGFVSSDYVGGGSSDYPLASYAEREVIWKAHWNYLLGFIYTIQHGVDARIPAGLKTNALTYGFAADHYYSPHENDEVFWNPQLYVREGVRLVGDAILNGNDLTMTDGTAPRISTKTVAAISYQMDSHAMQRVANETSAGVWTTKNEGGLGVVGGGVDLTSPLPLEVVVPKASECTNGTIGFAVSATHVAFGAARMEYTMMQVGQSMGQAAAMQLDDPIQDVDYSALRTALLASAELSGEVAPVLPQVN